MIRFGFEIKRRLRPLIILLFIMIMICSNMCITEPVYAEYYDQNGPEVISMPTEEFLEIAEKHKAAGTPYFDQNGTPIYVNEATGQTSYSYFEGADKILGYDYSKFGGSSSDSSGLPSSAGKSGSDPRQSRYSHDFDTISETAEEALSYFTHDGMPESAYINVPMSSSENTIRGATLNASTTGKEDIIINFVEKDDSVSEDAAILKVISWHFSNVALEDDYELDLTAKFEKEEDSEYDGTYSLSFNDGRTISANTLNIKIYDETIENGETYRLYPTESDDSYEEKASYTASENSISFPVDELTTYIVSKTDIPAEQKAKEEQEAAAAELSAEVSANEVSDTTSKEPEAEPEESSEVQTEQNASTDSADIKTESPILPVIGACVGILFIILFVCLFIKKRRS